MSVRRIVVPVLVVLLVGLFALASVQFGLWLGRCEAVAADKPDAAKNKQELADLQKQAEPFLKLFAKVAETVKPSVVSIYTKQKVEKKQPLRRFRDRVPHGLPFDMHPFFDFGFDWPWMPKEGLGSGVVVAENGFILTNTHVVEGFKDDEITVADQGDKKFEVKVIGRDPKSDLALIQAKDLNLAPVAFGNSDTLQVGEWVIAIGSPFGYTHSVSAGIISAKGRRGVTPKSVPFAIEDFLQTDAAINPGNSGGPLINLRGEVIGVNTAIASRTGGYEGIGFAIPSNLAKKVMDSLKSKGKVVRGYLGIEIADISDSLAERMGEKDEKAILEKLGLKEAEGVFVWGVGDGAPAAEAGIEAGDVILEVDGKKMKKAEEVAATVREIEVGKKVNVVIWHEKAKKTLTVKIGEQPEELASTKRYGEKEGGAEVDFLGLSVQTLTPELARELGYENQKGVLVAEVQKGSGADRAGIKEGDLITKVGMRDIANVAEFTQAVKAAAEKKGRVTLYVKSEKRGRFVTIE